MNNYMKFIEKDLDLDGIEERELNAILNEAARDLFYNHLLMGQDVTYDMFVENMKVVLKLRDNESMILKEL